MKKHLILSLSLFFALTILFTSCSDAHPILGTESGKKQTVTLKVKSELFVVEANPLKSILTNSELGFLCQYVVYKENGEVYFEKTLLKDEIGLYIDNVDGVLPLTLDLPNGNYNVAILYAIYEVAFPDNFRIKPSNFETDYYNSIPSVGDPYTGNAYYETVKITVADNQSTAPISVVLQPMWSAITLLIADPQTLQVPAGTEAIELVADPIYCGFGIKSKLATKTVSNPTESVYKLVSSLRTEYTAVVMRTFSAKSGVPLNVNVKYRNAEGTKVQLTRTLTTINVDNGNNYRVAGILGTPTGVNDTGINNPQMSISLGEFNKTEIVIPFQ